jgi:hypothetical protein
MFGFAVRKINFDRIDFVKLILTEIDFKLKWFMPLFGLALDSTKRAFLDSKSDSVDFRVVWLKANVNSSDVIFYSNVSIPEATN